MKVEPWRPNMPTVTTGTSQETETLIVKYPLTIAYSPPKVSTHRER